jgi:hypothetical protein
MNQDWKKIALELGDYVQIKVRKLYWRTCCDEVLPKCESPESLVYEAIEKVLSDERKWDPDKHPDLIKYLKSIIDSRVNHLALSLDNKLLRQIPTTENGKNIDDILISKTTKKKTEIEKTPEELLLEKEKAKHDNEIFNELIASINDDEELLLLYDCFEKGIEKPEEIAKVTGLDITKIYQLRRKLDRLAFAFGKKKDLHKNN